MDKAKVKEMTGEKLIEVTMEGLQRKGLFRSGARRIVEARDNLLTKYPATMSPGNKEESPPAYPSVHTVWTNSSTGHTVRRIRGSTPDGKPRSVLEGALPELAANTSDKERG